MSGQQLSLGIGDILGNAQNEEVTAHLFTGCLAPWIDNHAFFFFFTNTLTHMQKKSESTFALCLIFAL